MTKEMKNSTKDIPILDSARSETQEVPLEECSNAIDVPINNNLNTKNTQHESDIPIENVCSETRDEKIECSEVIFNDQKEFHTMYQDIIDLMKSVTNQEQLRGWKAKIVPQLKIVLEPLEGVTMRKITELPKITPELVKLQQELNQKFDMNLDQIKNEREQISQTEHQRSLVKIGHDRLTPLPKHVSLDNYKTYIELENVRRSYKKRFTELLTDRSLDQFKSDCKKAVHTSLKKLFSDTSNLMKSYVTLHDLLSGKPVKISGTIINAANHPEGVSFCTDLLAEKVVLFGEFMSSSSTSMPFYFAALVLALWNDFADFGRLVLAHSYKFCPSLLPYYIPRGSNQPIEDLNRCRGYRYSDGVIEKQESFTRRLSGMMRLHAAMFLSSTRRGQRSNPHGMSSAWKWCSSILNLDPRCDVTSTLLGVFFETAGYEMERIYGRVFGKLVNFVREIYMPLILKVDSGENTERLRFILEEHRTKKRFDEPDGLLPKNFW